MKILNLYAGIGGNRKLWENVEITAVERDESIAKFYKDRFPDDNVIVGDAHQYLLDNYREFDFIWSSPSCPTHSRARFWNAKGNTKVEPKYPDMNLYQEILFLKHYFEGKYLVENVKPFYTPLIPPTAKIGRHLFWSNFEMSRIPHEDADILRGHRGEWEKLYGFSLKGYKFNQRTDKILRNCVNPETGLHILNRVQGILSTDKSLQTKLF